MKNKIISALLVACFSLALVVSANINKTEADDEIIVEETTKEETKEIEDTEKEEIKEDSNKETTVEVSKETTKTENKPSKKPVTTTPEETDKVESTEDTTDETVQSDGKVSLGTFKLTAYCNCSKCCGQWAGGETASGVMPVAGRTIAVDPSVIPLGTRVVINGHTYVAEDTGGAIKGNKIDIFFSSHSEAMNFGVQYAEVFIYR